MSQPPVCLLLAIHCHQPVGNFEFVLEEAYRKAYEPFLTVLERHPDIRVTLHYSGILWDWFQRHQPTFLERLRRLVARGRVELLGGGYYEPILPLIPEADRQGQLALMRQTITRLFGQRPSGCWLTERVWEPELPATLARGGIRYTMLDVNQFRVAASVIPPQWQMLDEQGWDLLGCYVTEYGQETVLLFPASTRLRYTIPFQDVAKTIDLLRRAQRPVPVAMTYADDGEKFGLWPKTHEWVYTQGWLEQFFSALERESAWLTTSTFSQYLRGAAVQGRVYLPCGSYQEMLEWSGGSFRNFFVKYPEANAMYHKMLSVSERLQIVRSSEFGVRKRLPRAPRPSPLLARAQRELYMAQCNDAYWHGVFGGLYLAHLRRAVYGRLIQAERLVQSATRAGRPLESRDVDGDGRAEVLMRNRTLSVVVDPDEDGAVTEIDAYASCVNLVDTLSRRREPYHDRLAKQAGAAEPAPAPVSVHNSVTVKELGLETLLACDDHRRACFLDSALSAMPTLGQVVRSTWGEYRLWSGGAWHVEASGVRRGPASSRRVVLRRDVLQGWLRKTITLSPTASRLGFRYEMHGVDVPVIALEFNLGLRDPRLAEPLWQDHAKTIEVRDAVAGVAVSMRANAPTSVVSFPIDTVSGSEEGLERTPQGLAVVFLWSTGGSHSYSCDVDWVVAC